MVKVCIVYDSKYGNTKLAAEIILEGMKSQQVEAQIGNVRETDPASIVDCDAIVLGAPNHMGRPSRTMKRYVETLAGAKPKATAVAVFGTYSGSPRDDRAVKKLEKLVEKNLPSAKLVLHGLSVRVNGIPGPIVDGELPKCAAFGKSIVDQLK